MGLIRKTLFVATAGAVAPHSAKQRVALQTLAAVQGKPEAEAGRAGTRRAAAASIARAGNWDHPVTRLRRRPRVEFTAAERAYMAAHVPRR